MYPIWLLVSALLIAIYCLTVYIRGVITCGNKYDGVLLPKRSFMFLVKNQEHVIEGLIRKVYALADEKLPVELVIIDTGSTDQTRLVIERMAANIRMLKFVPSCEGNLTKKIRTLCEGSTVYCFDLTSTIDFCRMAKTLESILLGSGVTSLYRTKVLSRNDTAV